MRQQHIVRGSHRNCQPGAPSRWGPPLFLPLDDRSQLDPAGTDFIDGARGQGDRGIPLRGTLWVRDPEPALGQAVDNKPRVSMK
jgi:hypothetical protein